MSGVIDEHGQWERCNGCAQFVMFAPADGGPGELRYEQPSEKHPYGRDLCVTCFDAAHRVTLAPIAELREALDYCEQVLRGAAAGDKYRAEFLRGNVQHELCRRELVLVAA